MPPATPPFLSNCASFGRYLADVPEGNVVLPAYETVSSRRRLDVWRVSDYVQNDGGDVIVHAGEVFCRVPDCPSGKVSGVLSWFYGL